MPLPTQQTRSYSEADIQKAISGYKSGMYSSILNAALACCIPNATLQLCMSGGTSRSDAYEYRQILSNVEEKTLVKWISHLIRAGFLVPSILAIQMAEEVRHNRFQLIYAIISYPRPIGKS